MRSRFAGVLFFFLPFFLTAQHLPKPGILTIEDGLGFRKVVSIAQDAEGLMWFGTSQGLERYDGHEFISFGSGNKADFNFPGEEMQTQNLVRRGDSSLWLIANGRLYVFYPKSFEWADISALGKINGRYRKLCLAPNNTVWAVLEGERKQHLLRFDSFGRVEAVAQAVKHRKSFTALHPDTAGNIWWSTITEGLRCFTPDGKQMHEAKLDSYVWFEIQTYLTPVFVDKRGRVFVFPKSVNEIWEYHPMENRYDVVRKKLPSPVNLALEDSRGNLWFASKNCLVRWNGGFGSVWTDFTPLLKKTLEFSSINSLFEDRAHLIWVATDNGLFKLPVGQQVFRNYLSEPGTSWGNAMRGIFSDEAGRIFFYCENGKTGLYRLDTGTGTAQPVSLSLVRFSGPSSMDNAKMFFLDEKTGSAWTITERLLSVNLKNGSTQVIKHLRNVAEKNKYNPFLRLRDGTFLVGSTLSRLSVYKPASDKLTRLKLPLSATELDIKTTCFLENSDGRVWVGTSGGLYRVSRSGAILERYTAKTTPGLSNDHVLALHTDAKGQIWVGTFGGGLHRIQFSGNKNLPEVRCFTTNEGLCDDNVVAILEDNEGNIWASTYNGLSCYSPRTGTFQNFFEEDGLPNNEFNYASAMKGRNGHLWFGGLNGVVAFDPADILTAPRNPPLVLTYFAKHNGKKDRLEKTQIARELAQNEAYVLRPNDQWFEFGWALPNYIKPAQNRYYARLDGLDRGWNFIGNEPILRYNRLPAGTYVLHIKGTDSKGNPSSGGLALHIVVQPYFYQTWWFYLLVLLGVACAVFFAARYRFQRRLELELMRTRIASDLHDEVGSMLAGLAMQAELLESGAQAKDASRLARIGAISREAVSKMRDLVWGLDSRRDRVHNLLERMQEVAAEQLGPMGITCQFELGTLPLEKKVPVDMRQHLFLIYKEALTNVVRHSHATAVFVRFGNFGGRFELVVRNNGANNEPNSIPHTGLGLSNMEVRAKKLGGTFTAGIEEGGFRVRLVMRAI
ncbi:MAG: two-component regulator propeller domain-containing protein [Saprospiraceae bacterium]